MKRPKTIIKAFIGQVCYGPTPCTRINLHMGDTKTPVLWSKEVSKNGITSVAFEAAKIPAIIDEILDYINEGEPDDDEDDIFYLNATWDDGELEDIASRPIKPSRNNGNAAAFQNQSWRHIEAVMRINASMAESMAKMGNVQMNHASRMVEEYGDVHLRLAEAQQGMLDRSHERQLEAKRDERQAAMIEAGMQGLLACLPMFAGKLAGILPMGAGAIKASPQYQMMKAMFENTQPEQWPHILAWLESYPGTPAEKAALKMGLESMMQDMINAEQGNGTNGQHEAKH